MLVIDGKYNNEDGMGTGRMYRGLLACFTGSVDLSLMASTVVVAVMTIEINSSATIIGRRRVRDRWIPFKFPERMRVIRFE